MEFIEYKIQRQTQKFRMFFLRITILNVLLQIVVSSRSCIFNTVQPAIYHQYQSGTQCYPCRPQCLSCISSQDQSCKNGNCEIGFYHKMPDNKCIRCMDLCERCQEVQNNQNQIRCLKCLDGYYYNQIDKVCTACLPGAKQCTYSSSLLCFDGYFFDANSLTCKTCSTNCLICSSRQSCQFCASSFVVSLTTFKCIQCPISNCQTCVYLSSSTYGCNKCLTGFKLFSNSLCMKYSCEPSNCLQCQIQNTVCSLCQQQYFLFDGRCYYGSSIMCKYGENGTDYGRCTQCLPMVSRQVQSSEGYCVMDISGYGYSQWGYQNLFGYTSKHQVFFVQQICEYPYTSGTLFSVTHNINLELRPSFLIMITANIILQDSNNNPSDNFITVSLNEQSTDITQLQNIQSVIQKNFFCSLNPSSTDLKIGRISKVLRIGSKIYENSFQQILENQQNFLKLQLQSDSEERFSILEIFIQAQLCLSNNCFRCYSANACQECFYPYFVQDFQCVLQCQVGYNKNEEYRTCTFQCIKGYYIDNLLNQCIKCPFQCLTCISQNVCTECQTGFYLNSDSTCQTFCQNQLQFPSTIDKKCETCPNPCLTCQENGLQIKCTSCILGFYYEFQCLLICPQGYIQTVINQNPRCQLCSYPCKTCSFQVDVCLSCVSPFNLLTNKEESIIYLSSEMFESYHIPIINADNSTEPNITQIQISKPICLQQCPKGYYTPINDNICLKCSKPCKQCLSPDSDNCLECSYGYLLLYQSNNSQSKMWGSCVNLCPEGTYLKYNDKKCQSCSNWCQQCFLSQQQQIQVCFKCSQGYFLQNGVCVSQCANGWGQDQICQECKYPCKICTASNSCIQCYQDYYLFSQNSTCTLRCPSGYYNSQKNEQINKPSTCEKCPQACRQCINQTQCISCQDEYTFQQQNGRCISEQNCLAGYFLTNMTCQLCSEQCLSCLQFDSFCLSCSNRQYYLIQQTGKCQQTCPKQYIPNDFDHKCLLCDANCLTCSQSINNCTSCSSPLYLFTQNFIGKCLLQQNCHQLYGYFSYSVTSTCKKCIQPCIDCQTVMQCYLCDSGYFLIDGKCLEQCKEGYYKKVIRVIQSEYFSEHNTTKQIYLNDNIQAMNYPYCQLCHPNCLICQSLYQCSSCQSNYFLQLFQDQQTIYDSLNITQDILQNIQNVYFCMPTCPENFYSQNLTRQCKQCQYPCQLCTDILVCLTCHPGFIFYQGRCIQNCPQTHYLLNQTKHLSCQLCNITGCISCSNNISCLSCISGYFYFQPDMACLTECPQLYYEDDFYKKCISCVPPCVQCENEFHCTSCVQNYFLKDNRCYSICPLGSYEILEAFDNKICIQCNQLCLKCLNQSFCQTCVPDAYLTDFQNGTILCQKQCPLSFYLNKLNNYCQPCSNLCLTCQNDRNLCTSCKDGKFIQNKECKSQCSLGYFLNMQLAICQKCSSQCLQCDKQGCFRCENSYLVQNQFGQNICSNQCQIGTFKNTQNFQCQKCSKGCQRCESQQVCLQCNIMEGYALLNTACIQLPCPYYLYYYQQQNQCLYQCNTKIHLISTQKNVCYNKDTGCPKDLILRQQKECVSRCSIDEYIGWGKNDEIKCLQGQSANLYRLEFINLYNKIRILVILEQIIVMEKSWQEHFNNLILQKKQSLENNRRALNNAIGIGQENDYVPVEGQIFVINSSVTNVIVFDVNIIQDQQSNSFGDLISDLRVTIKLKQYPKNIMNSQQEPIQNKQAHTQAFNIIILPQNHQSGAKFQGLSIFICVSIIFLFIGLVYRSFKNTIPLLHICSLAWQHIQIFQIAAFFNIQWGSILGKFLRGYGILYNWGNKIQTQNLISPSPPMFYVNTIDCSLANVLPSIIMIIIFILLMILMKILKQKQLLNDKLNTIFKRKTLLIVALLVFTPDIFLFSIAKISSTFTLKNPHHYLSTYPIQILQLIFSFIFIILGIVLLVRTIIKQYNQSDYLDPGIIPQKKPIIRQLPLYYQIRKIGLIILVVAYPYNGLYSISFGVVSTMIALTMLVWYQPYKSQIRYRLVITSEAILLITFILMFILALNPELYESFTVLIVMAIICNWLCDMIYPVMLISGTKQLDFIINQQQKTECSSVKVDTQSSPQNLISDKQQQKITHSHNYVEQVADRGRQADQSGIEDSQNDQIKQGQKKQKFIHNNQTKRLARGITNNYRYFKHYDIVDEPKVLQISKMKAVNLQQANSDQQLIEKQLKLKQLLYQYRKQNSNPNNIQTQQKYVSKNITAKKEF